MKKTGKPGKLREFNFANFVSTLFSFSLVFKIIKIYKNCFFFFFYLCIVIRLYFSF